MNDAGLQQLLQKLKDKDIPKAEAMLASEKQKAKSLSQSPEWQNLSLKEQLQTVRVAKMYVLNAQRNLFLAKRSVSAAKNHGGEALFMKDSTSLALKILYPEQESEPKADEKPWLRQKQEPARWYMRFQRYKDLGAKRSLRAVVASEPQGAKATKGHKDQAKNSEGVRLSDLSVPGAWKRAAKVWNWKARAEAYDIYVVDIVVENHLDKLFDGASLGINRIEMLKGMLNSLQSTYNATYKIMTLDEVHKIMAHMQSLLKDIREEMAQYDEAVSRVALTRAMGREYRQLTPEELQARKKKQ